MNIIYVIKRFYCLLVRAIFLVFQLLNEGLYFNDIKLKKKISSSQRRAKKTFSWPRRYFQSALMCPSKIQSHKLYQFSILLGVSLSEVNFASCQFYDRIILWQSFYTRVYLWNYRSINIPVKIFFANSLSKPHRKNLFNWSKVEKKTKHPDG